MLRLSDEKFITMQPNMDNIYGIRIENGEFYLLAYMENAEHYHIKQSLSSDGDPLSRDSIVCDGEILTDDTTPVHVRIIWEMDDDGKLLNQEDENYQNVHDCFLSMMKPYTRNNKSDGDHDILILTRQELMDIADVLRDGDYIIVMWSLPN